MEKTLHQTFEMKKEKKKTSSDTAAALGKDAAENPASELELPIWSVLTFDECAASSLTYAEAAEKLQKLKAERVSGLCIVTDQAAAGMKANKK